MIKKRKWLAMLILEFILGIASVGTANAQTSIQGAWEMRHGGNVWVISFIEDSFVIFRNSEMFQFGTYTLNPSSWGISFRPNRQTWENGPTNANTLNHPRNLVLEFGFERDWQGFTYDISANELVLSDTGWRTIQQSGYISQFPLGTYRRSSEPSEAGNLLIGTWRQNYINNEGEVGIEMFRFFPNGKGVLIGFPQNYSLYDASLLSVTYELMARQSTGQISLWQVDTSTPNWESVVFRVLPFVIEGNILRIDFGEGATGEYRKR